MKVIRKYLSLILILSMLVSSFSFAYGYVDQSNKTVTDSGAVIEELALENVMQGETVFYENKGIHDKSVDYYVNAVGGTIFYSKKGETTIVVPLETSEESEEGVYWAFREYFLNASNIKITPEKETSTKNNFFIGDDASKHQKKVKGYKSLSYGEVYNNINVRANVNQMTIEKIFDVAPGGVVEDIQIEIEGADSLLVNLNGELELITPDGISKMSAPYAYQVIDGVITDVEVAYTVENNVYGFEVGEYNPDHLLTIDPAYIASFIGEGAAYSIIEAITTDDTGYVYITGSTKYATYPTITGGYSMTMNGSSDVIVSKFDPNFTELLASTFIGGSSYKTEKGFAIEVSSDGYVYVAGYTDTSDFPMFGTPYNSTSEKNVSFVVKFPSDLSDPVASTFIAKAHDVSDMFIEENGNIVVAGTTGGGFETTTGSYQETSNPSYNSGYVSRYDANLSTLIDSTLISSDGADDLSEIKLSANGDILLSGNTYSSTFPTTTNAYSDTVAGNYDAFVAVMSNDLTTLKAATLIGSTGLDRGNDIAEDIYGNLYIVGDGGNDMPSTTGAYQETSTTTKNAYIAKFDRSLNNLLALTYLGTSGSGMGIEINKSNEVIVAGQTSSDVFPITPDAYDSTYERVDGYVTKLNLDLSEVIYSTYIGGNMSDDMSGTHLSDNDQVYVTGETSSSLFPVTDGAYSSKYGSKVSYVFIVPDEMTGLAAATRAEVISNDSNNIGFGAYSQNKNLLSVTGTVGLSFNINYNSIYSGISPLESKWRLSFDEKIIDVGDGVVQIDKGDGTRQYFTDNGVNYEAALDSYHYDKLDVDQTPSTDILTINQELTKEFTNGKIASEKTKTNDTVSYSYDVNGEISRITEVKSGRYIDLIYDAQSTNRLMSIRDNMNRTVSFTYDDVNGVKMLKTITDPENNVTTFTYNDNLQLLTEILSNSTESYLLFTNTYDSKGRLETVDDNNPLNQVITYAYDTDSIWGHIIVSKTDQLGNTTESVYDSSYNLVSFTDEENNTTQTTFVYGKLVGVADALGNESIYTYNTLGQVETITNPKGLVTTYTYYPTKPYNLHTVSNVENGETAFEYNANNDITKVTKEVTIENPETYSGGSYGSNPQDSITEYKYDGNGDLDYIISPEGYVTDITLDANGQLIKVENKDNITGILSTASTSESYTYDGVGRMLTVKDALNNEYSVEYYDNNLIRKITNPLLETMDYTYFAHGGVNTVSDYEGEVTSYVYDNNLNLSEIVDPIIETPVDQTTTFTYDGLNRLQTETDRNNNYKTYEYFNNDWLKKVTNEEDHYQRYEYYANGNVSGIFTLDQDNLPNEKEIVDYTYDELGNVLLMSDALNNTTSNTYDDAGRLISTTDAKNSSTQFNYDELNRLVMSIDANLNGSRQVFDKEGRTLYVQDQDDIFTSVSNYLYHYDYDSYGRLQTINYAGVVKAGLTYKTNSDQVATLTNGRGNVTSYDYDVLGRTERIIDEINIREYDYNPTTNTNTITTKELVTETVQSTIEYQYNANGQITNYTDENGNVITYTYYPEGHLKTMAYPGNKTVTYTYNDANQLETVKDWNNNTSTYTYNSSGELISLTRPNGTIESYTYYKNGWLKTKVDKDSLNNIISEYTYLYDKVGNIIDEDGNGDNIGNVYSDLNELTLYQNLDDSQVLINQFGYAYDDAGNLTTVSDENGVVSTMAYADGNKLSTFNSNAVLYDNDGNMTTGPLNGTSSTYTYNARNLLTSVGTSSYIYDAEGRRIQVTENGDTIDFVVNPMAAYNQILIKEDSLGVKTYYVYGLGLISEETNTDMTYYHYDKRGSTIALTDASEVVTDDYSYGPYGEFLTHNGTSDVLFQYNGKFGVITDENNLIFMMTRYYNTDIRRFINQDSVIGSIGNSLSTNQFIYTENNPVNFFDPKGMSPIGIAGITEEFSMFDPSRQSTKGTGKTYSSTYTYGNRYGDTVSKEWTISDSEFLDSSSLTQQQITSIMNSKNEGLVERGFDVAVYEYVQGKGINPKVILQLLHKSKVGAETGIITAHLVLVPVEILLILQKETLVDLIHL